MNKIILFESIRALKERSNLWVLIFYRVLLIVYVIVLAVAFVPQVQSTMMKKFHPGVLPFGQWAICQFLPSMYNFKNEMIISQRSLPLNFKGPIDQGALKFSVNHYPLRMIYFSNVRKAVYQHLPMYIYLRNAYRGREIISSYLIEKSSMGGYPVLLNVYEYVDQ